MTYKLVESLIDAFKQRHNQISQVQNFPPFELIVSNGVVGAVAAVAAAVAVVVDESHSRFEI